MVERGFVWRWWKKPQFFIRYGMQHKRLWKMLSVLWWCKNMRGVDAEGMEIMVCFVNVCIREDNKQLTMGHERTPKKWYSLTNMMRSASPFFTRYVRKNDTRRKILWERFEKKTMDQSSLRCVTKLVQLKNRKIHDTHIALIKLHL